MLWPKDRPAEKRWREYSNSTEKPSEMYKKAFLYFDNVKTPHQRLYP
jgi:hypothetical protein